MAAAKKLKSLDKAATVGKSDETLDPQSKDNVGANNQNVSEVEAEN